MSKNKVILVVAAMILGFILQADAQEVCTKENPVLQPQYALGDAWVLNEGFGDFKIEFEKYENGLSVHKRTRASSSSVDYLYASPDGNMVKNTDFSGKSLFKGDEKPMLRFPLFKGKSWTETFKFESRNRAGEDTGIRTRKISVRVVGPETITVAGQAMVVCRLEAESYILAQSNPYEQNETYYYSPQAKRVVKYQSVIKDWGERSYKLESYKLGDAKVAEK